MLLSCAFYSTSGFYLIIEKPENQTLERLLFFFTLAFFSALFCVHFFAYCFSGILHKIFRKLWPKGIDYLYYFSASVSLLLIAANILNAREFLSSGIKIEAVMGIYLLNFKFMKTSYEIFPGLFQNREILVREPIFGEIW